MTQKKVLKYKNPSAGTAARVFSFGFKVDEALVKNITTGKIDSWDSAMDDGSHFDYAAGGTYHATNGITPVKDSARFGAAISGFTNANPGVITVDDTELFGFSVGDTVKVAELADDGSKIESLNGSYKIASITPTGITLTTSTVVATHSVYVSGGFVSRVTDVKGFRVPITNQAILGLKLGTGVIGADDDEVTIVASGG